MSDIILLLLVIVAIIVAWIEGIPKRFDVKLKIVAAGVVVAVGISWIPAWYGWVVVIVGLADLYWLYRSLLRDEHLSDSIGSLINAAHSVFAWLSDFLTTTVERFRSHNELSQTKRQTEGTKAGAARTGRVVFGTIAIFVSSPITAIPYTLTLVLLLTAADAVLGDSYGFDKGWPEALKYILGHTIVTLIVTLDVIARWFVVTVPLLLGVSFVAARAAAASERFWRRLFYAGLLLGALYPVLFILADAMGSLDEPVFN
jgi:hypothetical protein